MTAVKAFEQAGAEVVGVAVIVDRGAGDVVRPTGLSYRSAFSLTDLGLAV
jgi:orotate phosphoribosyltransferase